MAATLQRPLKGSRISSFYPVKSLPAISALDSAFQLQEYISLLIRLDVNDVDRIVSIPGRAASDAHDNGETKGEDKDAEKDAAASVNVDEACWVYEQLRRLAQDLSHPLITTLQQECTRSTCPEMKAGEWLYLCVAHGNEGAMEQCCAIDYILHTLDSATALLNSPRAFPSRLSVPQTSHRHFSSLARRLGRIFAHAYFHHREAFEQAEAESSLYARFLALTSKFDLVPAEFLVIPPRLTPMSDDERGGRGEPVEPPRLLAASLEPRREQLAPDDGRWTIARPIEERDRGTSPPGPAGQQRNESPRKFGRNRTDTMVYSEAFSVAEELAKGDLSEVDIDREIAAERAAAAVEADLPVPVSPVDIHEPTEERQEPEAAPVDEEEPKPEVTESEPEPQLPAEPTEEAAEEAAEEPAAEPVELVAADSEADKSVEEEKQVAAELSAIDAEAPQIEVKDEVDEEEEEGEEEDEDEDEDEEDGEDGEEEGEEEEEEEEEPAPTEAAAPRQEQPAEEAAPEADAPAPADHPEAAAEDHEESSKSHDVKDVPEDVVEEAAEVEISTEEAHSAPATEEVALVTTDEPDTEEKEAASTEPEAATAPESS